MHCVAEAEVRYRMDKNRFGVHGGDAHLDTEYVTTPIWWAVIRNETCTDDGFRRTHEAISDRFIVTDDTLGVGTRWTWLLGSVDMQEPTLIPTFAIPCTHRIHQRSGTGYEPGNDERGTDRLDSICTSCFCRTE